MLFSDSALITQISDHITLEELTDYADFHTRLASPLPYRMACRIWLDGNLDRSSRIDQLHHSRGPPETVLELWNPNFGQRCW